jgi:diguanylate cyclase (GGDEF)-like protein/PAS domain S-box-containing protein
MLIAVCVAVYAATGLFLREALRRKKKDIALGRLRQAADASSDLITIMTRSGRIEYVNEAVERATGYLKSELINRRHSPRLPWYGDAGLVRRMRETVLSGAEFAQKIEARTKEGGLLTLGEHVAPFLSEQGAVTRLISTARDLTREQDLENRLNYLDRYDALTGLPNRHTLIELLEQAIAAAKKSGAFVSVLVLDIDRFKNVNDLCGAEAGDEVLRLVAQRIRSSVSLSDIAARTGNDEFTVIHVDDRKPVLAGAIAQQLRTSLSQQMTAVGQDLVVTVSTGIAVFPADGDDSWSLLKNADLALARA